MHYVNNLFHSYRKTSMCEQERKTGGMCKSVLLQAVHCCLKQVAIWRESRKTKHTHPHHVPHRPTYDDTTLPVYLCTMYLWRCPWPAGVRLWWGWSHVQCSCQALGPWWSAASAWPGSSDWTGCWSAVTSHRLATALWGGQTVWQVIWGDRRS